MMIIRFSKMRRPTKCRGTSLVLINTPQGMAEFMHDGSFELRFLGILVKPAEIHG
ncbi:hypothetical protein IFU39_03855 [Paenibacillus sp. CFBP 13594]|nr:hypothetical protein [Paenibacillus sp. CFBP 13594]